MTAQRDNDAQQRYQWRLYTATTAGIAFFAGMLANNWLQRHVRFGAPPSPSTPPTQPLPAQP
jgi:hypothetical protein